MSPAVKRKPAHKRQVGRQDIWENIRLGRDFFTVNSLVDATGAAAKTVRDYLRCLKAGGVVREKGDHGYELIKDCGHHAPRLKPDGSPVTQGAGVENMWRSMRMLPQFDAREIAAHSTTDSVTVSDETARAYIGMLLKTGYLRVITKAVPNKRMATYRLIRNSGPKPPQIQRVKQVYDPNTSEVYLPEGSA